MALEKDFLLDVDDDLIIHEGDFLAGESLIQDIGIVLRLNQGDLKSDPLLGPNLIQLEKGTNINEYKQRVKVHIQRDGKDYDQVKNIINEKFKTQ